MAGIVSAFGAKVIFHSVTGKSNVTEYEQVDKETLLRESDFLSLHCPLSDLFRNFIDTVALKQIKKTAEVTGLSATSDRWANSIFAFHIHEGGRCTGNGADPFADVGSHYNPEGCQHPYHAGDLPPLFGNNGYAFMSMLIDRFSVSEIIEKTVIIHDQPDDFRTQPAGAAGAKIACGEIRSRRW